MQLSKDQFKEALRNPFGRTKPAPRPASAPTGNVDRAHQIAVERSGRDQARVPYRAPHGAPIAFARLATRGATQVQEVVAYLASSGLAGCADLVYGVSRVPDRISPTMSSNEGGRVVEWDIVHAATAPLPPANPPTAAWFDAADTWVARRVGDPSVPDEDLALAYLASAGIGPEHCLGIARHLTIDHLGGGSEGDTSVMLSRVSGVLAFHVLGPGAVAYQQMTATRPIALSAGPPAGAHLEVLNWAAIARAVQPSRAAPVPIPSPFPYLPTTPQELLRAYIEVVGVYPGDCFSTQVTEDAATDLTTSQLAATGFTLTSNHGINQVCADGKERRRLVGGSLVVIAYRDRPEYATGRERWAAYQRDVLQASLSNRTGLRDPIDAAVPGPLSGPLRGRLSAAEKIGSLWDGESPWERIPPYRYCWPPRP